MSSNMFKNVILKDILAEKGYIRGPFGSALKRSEMCSEGIPVYEQQNAIYDNRNFRYFIDEDKYQELKRFTTLKDDLIIKYNGDSQKVERDFKNSKLAYSMENDIYTIFTNILLENDKSSYALKKMAVSYLKDTIKKGLDDALPTGNICTTHRPRILRL